MAEQSLTELPSYNSCTQIIESSPKLESALTLIRSSNLNVSSDIESGLIHSRFKENFELHFAALLNLDNYGLTPKNGSNTLEIRLTNIEHPTIGVSTKAWVDIEVRIPSNEKQDSTQHLRIEGKANYTDSLFGPQRLNLAIDRAICSAISLIKFAHR
ncbi:hypothetical protein [Marinobacterium sp. LSUCC0821]|uniref:hypothetical protein n=1 Tax=Marinobacterium sp. LSUCC0821 TaxID=2668067 RepID=UPI001452A392|nr:hypothetical protein [Marinobacterium sp. LSUCC0821]QJD72067.1 hypothetical protein HH196_10320 [Marinobacterium sp. LSUCC0821]